MVAVILQVLGLVGLPVGLLITEGVGGAIAGAAVSAVYVGLALEKRGT